MNRFSFHNEQEFHLITNRTSWEDQLNVPLMMN